MKNASVPILSLSWMSLVQEDLVSGDYLGLCFPSRRIRRNLITSFSDKKKTSVCAGMGYFGYNICSTRSVHCQHTITAGADLAVLSSVTYSPEIQECLVTYREGNKKPNLIGISRILIGHSAKSKVLGNTYTVRE